MTFTKALLSGSTDGKQVLIAGTGTDTATLIHTAVSGSTSLDEVYLYAHNQSTSDAPITIQWGGTNPKDSMVATITSKAGRVLLVDGKLIQNSLIVSAYTSSGANTIAVDGFVNRIA